MLDNWIFEQVKKKPNTVFFYIVIASYLYYLDDQKYPIMLDTSYDKLCNMALDNYDELEHRLKHMCPKENLEAGSLFNLRVTDYPEGVIRLALLYSKLSSRNITPDQYFSLTNKER